jgi:dihydrofolate reductase
MLYNKKLIAIAAVSTDGTIGVDNEIPWRIPEDFKHFRNTTINNTLLVGYVTYLTLPKKAFENRNYIILNKDQENDLIIENNGDYKLYFCNDISILEKLTDINEIYVAGGSSIYQFLIDYCDEAIITWVYKEFPNGNRKFPIEKIFSNFDSIRETDIQRSISNISYKIIYYKKYE